MNKIAQAVLIILLLLCVLGYTVFNYAQGKIDNTFFLVSAVVLIWPLINILRNLIDELRSR